MLEILSLGFFFCSSWSSYLDPKCTTVLIQLVIFKVYLPVCEVLVSSSSWFSIVAGGQASYHAQDLYHAQFVERGKKKVQVLSLIPSTLKGIYI